MNNTNNSDKPSILQVWLAQTRANFLLLAFVLVLDGIAVSKAYSYEGSVEFSWFKALLLLIGVILAHISVNLFNEHSDYKTKIDFNTIRNPFSGGSGMLPANLNSPKAVLTAAILTLLIGSAIGIYYIIAAHWSLIILVIFGILTIIFYTNVLTKILLGEIFAGLTLGSLIVIGVYIGLTSSPNMLFSQIISSQVLILSIPPGILTFLLLLLNEFPDAKADKEGGRFHLVIFLGHKKAAYLYILGIIATYGIIILCPIYQISSYWIYLSLATLPLAIKVSITALTEGDQPEKIIPAMGQNVMIVLLTDLLLAVGLFLQ